MPLLLFPLALLALLALAALALPFSVIARYRAGTARRRARPWLVLLNVFGMGVSALFFLGAGAVSSTWVPGAFSASAAGLGGGLILGIIGLRLTRWEASAQSLFYTPNRWLVLAMTVGVALRLGFGFWRAWEASHAAADASWLAESGFAGSMGTGGIVLGYYLAFWLGVWLRIR